MQTSYALRVQGNDFAKVFDLCATVEDLHAKRRLMTEEPVVRLL